MIDTHGNRSLALTLSAAFFSCLPLFAQGGAGGGSKVPPETEPGIPVTDKLTAAKCGTCHKADAQGNLTRISWIRTTPEGWEESIKRMVRLNGLTLSPEEARGVLTYLAKEHGLAPEETQPYRWYLEMKEPETEPTPSPEIRMACASCHAFGRPETWRRSATEWHLLVNMHLGYFPVAEFISFHAQRRPDGYGVLTAAPAAPGQTAKAPVDLALDYLIKNNSLHSAAWSNWRAAMRDPDLKGTWLVEGTEPGKGKYYGTMTVKAGAAPGSFESETSLTRAADGTKLNFHGKSVVYTGYEWRGRSEEAKIGTVREVMTVAPDQAKIEGRWFWGGYQDFGLNIAARRDTGEIMVLGTDVPSVRAGSKSAAVRIFGGHFPRGLTAADIDVGAGTKVTKVVSVKPDEISILIDADAAAISGWRSVSVKTRTAQEALAVYDKIDYIKVATDSGLAHLGGTTHPKGYVQFEALAYNRGLDGKPNTADDVSLGPIPVKWSLEEFMARFNDDDREFVGSIGADGLFTPAGEGPNPQRRFSTNNTGDVWVVATYPGSSPGSEALTAKSYLVVTVPSYMKWDEPEVAQ